MKDQTKSTLTSDAIAHGLGIFVTIYLLSRISQYTEQMTDINTHISFFTAGIKAGLLEGRTPPEDIFFDAEEDIFYDAVENEFLIAINETLEVLPVLKNTLNQELSRLHELSTKHFQRTLDKLLQPLESKSVPERILLYPQFNEQILDFIATNQLINSENSEVAKTYLKLKNEFDAMLSAIVGGVKELSFSSGRRLGSQIINVAGTSIESKQINNFIDASIRCVITFQHIQEENDTLLSMGFSRILPKGMINVALGGLAHGIIDSTINNEKSSISTLFHSLDNANCGHNLNLIYNSTTSLCSEAIQDFRRAYNTALQKQEEITNAINSNHENYIGNNALSTANNMVGDYLIAHSVNSAKRGDDLGDKSLLHWKACIKASTGVLSKLLYSATKEAGKIATEVTSIRNMGE